jgi:hypothetical protein
MVVFLLRIFYFSGFYYYFYGYYYWGKGFFLFWGYTFHHFWLVMFQPLRGSCSVVVINCAMDQSGSEYKRVFERHSRTVQRQVQRGYKGKISFLFEILIGKGERGTWPEMARTDRKMPHFSKPCIRLWRPSCLHIHSLDFNRTTGITYPEFR